MTANAQTNLAEITIGKLATTRASAGDVRQLAHKTLSDHQAAQTKLSALAKQNGVTLPSTPNAQQQSQAAQLTRLTGASFDQLYLRDQVAGHKLSLAGTNTELSSGSDSAVLAYTRGYLPVVTMHLQMAQDALNSSGGSGPGVVAAGSGGHAAPSSSSSSAPEWAALSAALAVLGAALVLLDRRRHAAQ